MLRTNNYTILISLRRIFPTHPLAICSHCVNSVAYINYQGQLLCLVVYICSRSSCCIYFLCHCDPLMWGIKKTLLYASLCSAIVARDLASQLLRILIVATHHTQLSYGGGSKTESLSLQVSSLLLHYIHLLINCRVKWHLISNHE